MAIVFDPPRAPADGTEWEDRGARPVRRAKGDGTVPDPSASVLFPRELGPINDIPADEITSSPRQCGVNGVEHSDAFNNADVRRTVVSWVNRILFENVSARSS